MIQVKFKRRVPGSPSIGKIQTRRQLNRWLIGSAAAAGFGMGTYRITIHS
jgi:hypothetical protein